MAGGKERVERVEVKKSVNTGLKVADEGLSFTKS